MTKVKKITSKELEEVTTQQTTLNELLRSLGILDVQKVNIHNRIKAVSDDIESTKEKLEKKYGQVNIDLSDGKYVDIEKEDEK
tara:strand:- start:221 stop:469 length:249 start_codon:yes stop_codon:yes gene_type:complete